MKTISIYILAALAEIAGCFCFFLWLKDKKSYFLCFPGVLLLATFAYLLTLVESEFAGRSYAAYGAIYIASTLVWLMIIENQKPNYADLIGACLCFIGGLIIIYGNNFLKNS